MGKVWGPISKTLASTAVPPKEKASGNPRARKNNKIPNMNTVLATGLIAFFFL